MDNTIKTAAVLYHKIDFDGICSFAIASRGLASSGYRVTPFPMSNCDTEIDLESLSAYDRVVILDISLRPAAMKRLFDLSEKAREEGRDFLVVWIDHHKSSIEDSVLNGYSLMRGYREPSGKAACELAWEYFHDRVPVPSVVALLSAYDIFDKDRFPWKETVLPFQHGMRYRYGLDAEKFVADFDLHADRKGAATMKAIMEEGTVAYNYMKDSGTRGVEAWGFPVTVAGHHKGYCCLTSQFGSLAFENSAKAVDATVYVCVNRTGPLAYKVSMYGSEGNTLDLGGYMKLRYNGGGHFNAAGGTLTLKEFKRLLTKSQI